MKEKVLIVEDKFVEADYLRLILSKAGYGITGMAHSVEQAQEIIKGERPDFVLLDIFLKGKLTGIHLAKQLADDNIPFVYLSASSNEKVFNAAKETQPYGFLIKPFRDKDLLVTMEIARYRHVHSAEVNVRKEESLKDKITEIANDTDSWENKLFTLCTTIKSHISFDYVTAGMNAVDDISTKAIGFLRVGYDEYQKTSTTDLLTIAGLKMKQFVERVSNTSYDALPAIVTGQGFEQACSMPTLTRMFADAFQVKSYIYFPLHLANGKVFIFCFYCRRPDTYTTAHIGLMNRLQKTMSSAVEKILSSRSERGMSDSKKSLRRHATRNEIPGFEGIVGTSRPLLNVFEMVTQVAYSDTSVLILGESGTGKERIADCIHNLSPRKNGPFVKVNCASLPATLIESELFGHERGSFTGAFEKRIGKFEKADGGTILLDEIGEMPPDLQIKLLRVLQEKYIERIGSRDTTKVDVRVIAATNRDLEKDVGEGRFRLDLYYRLNVFPILLPPLRERSSDIPLLIQHFVNIYNRKSGRSVSGVSAKVLENLMTYGWPGNIRELEHFLERGVLLAKGSIIEDLALPTTHKKDGITATGQPFAMKTIDENEREYIIEVLKRCGGRIWGPGGAAEILNVPPTTLRSKMKKLGIARMNTE